jgi:hypothetical protein
MYAMIRRADPLRRRAVSALLTALLHHPAAPSAAKAAAVLPRAQPLPPPAKWFHSSPAFLGFRETGAARAGARPEFAADEGWNYEEERKPAGVRAPSAAGAKVGGGAKEEGLEIAKLGISPEIVSKLAGKGITKLFPIQVRGSASFLPLCPV